MLGGTILQESEGMKVGESKVIESFKDGSYYNFLAVLENIRQEDNLVLENAKRVYFKRLSVIWTSSIRLQ